MSFTHWEIKLLAFRSDFCLEVRIVSPCGWALWAQMELGWAQSCGEAQRRRRQSKIYQWYSYGRTKMGLWHNLDSH